MIFLLLLLSGLLLEHGLEGLGVFLLGSRIDGLLTLSLVLLLLLIIVLLVPLVVLGGAPVELDDVQVLGGSPAREAHVSELIHVVLEELLEQVSLHHLVDLVQVDALLLVLKSDDTEDLALLHVEVLVELVLEHIRVVRPDDSALLDLLHSTLLDLLLEEELDVRLVLRSLPILVGLPLRHLLAGLKRHTADLLSDSLNRVRRGSGHCFRSCLRDAFVLLDIIKVNHFFESFPLNLHKSTSVASCHLLLLVFRAYHIPFSHFILSECFMSILIPSEVSLYPVTSMSS